MMVTAADTAGFWNAPGALVEFRVLGSVEVRVAGQEIDAGHSKRRAVLAVLLLDLGRTVSPDLLIDRVWGEAPPASVRNVLSGYLARLRAAIAAAAQPEVQLTRLPGGYLLKAPAEQLDLHRFRCLTADAASADDEQSAALLRQALGLWRGPALAGLDSPWLRAMRETLELERAAAVLELNEVRLRLGEHAALVSELSGQATASFPADERLIGQLMLALYRSGRQAEALGWFERTRRQLADGLGADPGPELRSLHQQILRADPALAAPGSAGTDPTRIAAAPAAPQQQPGAVADFTGRAADLLAAAVQAQWEAAAVARGLTGPDPVKVMWGRPALPLAGPLAAAASSRQFDPLPGMAPVSQEQLAEGRVNDLHTIYGGLGSGRLIVAGPPGSGKSGAAVLLILAALRHRARARACDRAMIPVPVLVTCQDWDPRGQPVADWLAGRLQQTYPLFTGAAGRTAARTLIAAGKIAVILDGLDEIAADLRPTALQALSQQASFRLVVLCRTDESASAASRDGILHGAAAIELRPVSAAEAAGYLERVQLDPPPTGWGDLIAAIRTGPSTPISSALNSPLTLTLVRDTYQAADARELLRLGATLDGIPAREATRQITGHLLDRVLPAAYAPRPGQPPPRYDLPAARRTLTIIAARMNEERTRDLHWWRIPTWLPPTPRAVSALRAALAGGLGAFLFFGFIIGGGLEFGLWFGAWGAFMFGFTFMVRDRGTDAGRYNDPPRRISRPRFRKVLTSGDLIGTLIYALAFVLSSLLSGGPGALGTVGGSSFAPGFAGPLKVGLEDMFADDPGSTSSRSPVTAWHDGRKFGLMIGLAAGLTVSLSTGLMVGLTRGFTNWLDTGLTSAVGLAVATALYASTVWGVFLTEVRMAIRWRTPIRLIRFLEDARTRNILRTVGPVYQFRHALLQDHLAAQPPCGCRKPGHLMQRWNIRGSGRPAGPRAASGRSR